MDSETTNIIKTIVRIAWLLLTLVILGMWGCPMYKVYSQTKEGEAEYARAESSRQITTLEATAKKQAATDLAAADTIRAHGVALSNAIIGESLKDNESYLHWLWIDNIEKNPNAVIYIPTEANLPIMEATRLQKPPVINVDAKK